MGKAIVCLVGIVVQASSTMDHRACPMTSPHEQGAIAMTASSSDQTERGVIRKVRDRLSRDQAIDDVRIIILMTGGHHDEKLERRFELSGQGELNWRIVDQLHGDDSRHGLQRLDRSKTKLLFDQILDGFDTLIPRSEARFLPDSTIGSLTIQLSDQSTTRFFLADRRDRLEQELPIAETIEEALIQLLNALKSAR